GGRNTTSSWRCSSRVHPSTSTCARQKAGRWCAKPGRQISIAMRTRDWNDWLREFLSSDPSTNTDPMVFDSNLLLIYLVRGLGVPTCLVLPLRGPVTPILVWAVSAVVISLLTLQLAFFSCAPEFGFDYHIFWLVGADIWEGKDPYAPEAFAAHPFLQP